MRTLGLLTTLALALAAQPARACDGDAMALFACEAAGGRKYIELCAPSPLAADSGFLVYRFGPIAKDGGRDTVELAYPASTAGSLRKFFAATYTHGGIYTQSVRFVTGGHSYRVFTASGPKGRLDAGVDVRDLRSGKVTTVACSEAPRFYIHDLEGLVPCDPDTPVGVACVR